jgi:GrpB-like predicted nucleotidyltransferase (UPF0157 family)
VTDPIIGPYLTRPIACHEWDPHTMTVAGRVAALLVEQAPDLVVEHVGSTSVPWCAGKGVVDLLVAYPPGRLEAAKAALAALGFQRQTSRDPFPEDRPMRVGSLVVDGARFNIHAHVVGRDSPEAAELRTFRERLRGDPALVAEYVARKRALLAAGTTDSAGYTEGKADIIHRAVGRA